MSFAKLQSAMAEAGQMAAAGFARPKLGLVSSYDPANYAVKVKLQPEDTETGWLPIVTSMAGAGFGAYYGPAIGDQCLVVFQEGDTTAGICLGFLPSDDDKPPVVQTGELHLIAKGQTASVILKPDGTITSKGTWTHTGSLHTTLAILCDTIITGTTDVVGGGIHLKTHGHTDPQGGVVGPPT